MPVVVTKSEMRYKPVTMLKNAKAWFITLADRAANWTPWTEKDDEGRGALSFADLEIAGALNPWQDGKVRGNPKIVTHAELKKLAEQQLLKPTGANKMAGEVIQAIIAPINTDPEQLKAILGEEEYKKFTAEKAEQFDDCVKYVQVDEDKFVELDGTELGESGFKAVFGTLKDAEKADSYMAMPTPGRIDPYNGNAINAIPFAEMLRKKTDSLKAGILSYVELSSEEPNWDDIESKAMNAVDGYAEWLEEAFETLKNQTTKSDAIPTKPKLTDRLKSLLWGQADKPYRRYARKGDENMTPEERREEMIEVVKATVEEMVAKAEQEEAAKADVEAQAAEKVEREELKTKIDNILEYIAAQKAEKEAEAAASTTSTPEAQAVAEKAEREQAEQEMKELKEKLAKLTEKMDALNRTPGGRAETEVATGFGGKKNGEAKKYDPSNPYDCFNTIGTAAGRA